MPQSSATGDLKCPHCGAKVGPKWKTCWLCGLELPASPSAAGTPSNLSESAAAPTSSGPSTIKLVSQVVGFLLAGTIALLMIGLVANGEYGGLIAMIILLVPAGLVTLTKSLSKRSQGMEMTAMEKVGTFLVSLSVTIGAIAALGIAAFVALFIACIGILSTSGGSNMFR